MVTRLAPNVWWIDLTGVNAYVVNDGGTLTLVDTGFPWQAGRVAKAITSVGDALGDVDRVLLTHFDFDHVGGLGKLDAIDAPVYIGRTDKPHLTGEDRPSILSPKGLFQRATDVWRPASSLPVEAVDDGDEIGSFTAYSAPGHTPGHTVYVSTELSAAMLGDAVREADGDLEVPPWFICESYTQTKETVRELSATLPAFDIACPGHGVPFSEAGSDRLRACAEGVTPRVG